MAFTVENPDFEKSPLTGMTRRHWVQAAKHLVDGVLQHIQSIEDPIVIPKQSDVCYPLADEPPHRFQAAEFEGLARTFMAAAPVIAEDPQAESNGINLRDYYAAQILQATDPDSPRYAGSITEFFETYEKMQYQQTVECGALVVGLMQCRDQIWQKFSDAEKGQVAAFLSDWAHGQTIGHNWRFFNVLMLTFLKVNGFEIQQIVMKDHLQHLMALYSGDGWYNDNPCYDLYNPWGYHFYGPLWCRWYGYEHEPELAAIMQQRNREFMMNWPRFYSRDGKQLMWGRSLIYRFGCSAALGAHFLMNDPVINPGFARRLASGNLLQFMGRDDVYINGVPCLGYYSAFDPLVQFYSCAASPFWVAKIFVALALPADSPFWTADENEGFWPELGDRTETVELEGPGIQIINRGDTGGTEILTGKVPQTMPYYNQLSFNTDYCYEDVNADGSNAANYSVSDGLTEGFRLPLSIGFNKFEDGVMYRTLNMKAGGGANSLLGYVVNKGMERIDLADIIIPSGVIRVDRVRMPLANRLHLGHFALPHLDGKAAVVEAGMADGCETLTASIDGRKVAMTSVFGWDGLKTAVHRGKNAEAEESTVVYADRSDSERYGGMEILITVMLHRQDGGEWTDDERMPIHSFKVLDWAPSGQPCGVQMELKDGRTFTIDYGNVEGNLARS